MAAPASPVSREAWEEGVRILEQWGFRVHTPPEVFAERPYGAEIDRQRARHFQSLWEDPKVKAIIGARGGYGSLKILPHLDFPAMRRLPKRLVGFSDLTNLVLTLPQRLGIITFHGPTLAQLPGVSPAARESLYRCLTSERPQELMPHGLAPFKGGTAEGYLAGGNLTTICHLLGTPFAPRFAGSILFLEDHNEALYRLDRLAHHLLFSGALEGVRGIVLGRFTGGAAQKHAEEVLALAFQPLGVPLAAGLPAGHHRENHTFPVGARVRLDASAGTLTLIP